jgi:Domain of unknown function (DUF4149)
VIGFLRFVGLMNAAVWLGAAVSFTFATGPAVFSGDMKALFGPANQQFPGAIAQILLKSYYHLHLTCCIIAFLHLLAEWLYLGRPARKVSLALLTVLFALTLAGGYWLQPKLRSLHATRYAASSQPAEREAAAKSFGKLHGLAMTMNLFMIFGLAFYTWRVANPSDSLRFLNPANLRG